MRLALSYGLCEVVLKLHVLNMNYRCFMHNQQYGHSAVWPSVGLALEPHFQHFQLACSSGGRDPTRPAPWGATDTGQHAARGLVNLWSAREKDGVEVPGGRDPRRRHALTLARHADLAAGGSAGTHAVRPRQHPWRVTAHGLVCVS